MRLPVAKEALKLIFTLAILTAILSQINGILAALSFVFLVCTVLFFRDPRRSSFQGPGRIVSPADGTILQIRQVEEEAQSYTLLSIFMSVLNVHINYAPVAGQVLDVSYRKGSFLRADRSDASTHNESNTLVIQGEKIRMMMRQIAGVLARRIICYCQKGDPLRLGQKVGLIQFGSRVDLYFPTSIQLKVKVGDKVKGAQSILGVIL